MRFARSLCTLTAVMLTACSTTSTPPSGVDPRKPLLTASCPDLTPLTDKEFGTTTLKLFEVAGQYHQCRCAAIPELPLCKKDK